LFYKLLSVILAVFFWFYVNNTENPVITRTYRVPLTLTDMREGLVLDDGPESVEVRAQGTSAVISQLTGVDFSASVDLSNARRGAAVYPVLILLPDGARLLRVEPINVELVLDEISGVTLPVRAVAVNAALSGYSGLEAVVTPSEIQVQGRLTVLETLDHGLVYYNLEGATESFSAESPVTLINGDGGEVPAENLLIVPSSVQIQVPVIAIISTREAPIRPMINGMLQTESLVRTVTVEPESATVTGPQETVSALEQIDTAVIDVSDITATTETEAPLVIPEGIQAAEPGAVKVSVSVEPVMGVKVFENIPFEVHNAPFGLYVRHTDSVIQRVAVRGAVDALVQLEQSGLRVFVDLTDMQPGTYMAGVTVQAPEGLVVEEITPAQIEVVLSRY
jgi:YbbR domain-containing protein